MGKSPTSLYPTPGLALFLKIVTYILYVALYILDLLCMQIVTWEVNLGRIMESPKLQAENPQNNIFHPAELNIIRPAVVAKK